MFPKGIEISVKLRPLLLMLLYHQLRIARELLRKFSETLYNHQQNGANLAALTLPTQPLPQCSMNARFTYSARRDQAILNPYTEIHPYHEASAIPFHLWEFRLGGFKHGGTEPPRKM